MPKKRKKKTLYLHVVYTIYTQLYTNNWLPSYIRHRQQAAVQWMGPCCFIALFIWISTEHKSKLYRKCWADIGTHCLSDLTLPVLRPGLRSRCLRSSSFQPWLCLSPGSVGWLRDSVSEWPTECASEPWFKGDDERDGDSRKRLIAGWFKSLTEDLRRKKKKVWFKIHNVVNYNKSIVKHLHKLLDKIILL